jgi:hypothetical protein
MKLLKFLQKIERKFHSFWISRCLEPFENLCMSYWRWLVSMPALKNSNNNIFNYFLAFLNILLFIITCICIPLAGILTIFIPVLIPARIFFLLGLPEGVAIVLGIPVGMCLARRYVFNDWGQVYR